MRVLTRHTAQGGRLPDLCEVLASDAHPPAMSGPHSGYLPLCFGCCISTVWKASAVDFTFGGIHSGRVSRCPNRTSWSSVLERCWRYVSYHIVGKNMFDTSILGLEFVLQLCVDDNERAGTILAVSSK